MVVLLSAVSAASLVCFIRVSLRGEVLKAGAFLVIAVVCGLWTSSLHVPGMRDFMPGPLVAFGLMMFCMSCDRHETPVWNWLLSPLGQALGGGMAIAGLILMQMCVAW
ncbi:MAG: hypothetical protein PHE68_00025 [Candidatus Peribacteraceae bacterium]|nr:hypothetical protein [Candidatus Peribacteraceae bacterium]MDD5074960.1 hypothetical protein [Candidatus Peribacteraceae bacterium]